jgi:hypothetical protein
MKVNIDISVYLKSGESVGNITGQLDFNAAPVLDDVVSLIFPTSSYTPPPFFLGLLRVEKRILIPNDKDSGISVVLSDLVVESLEHASAIFHFLEKGFSLKSTYF